jgi:hypothetical protein
MILAVVELFKFKKDLQHLIQRPEDLIITVNCLLFSGFKYCNLLFFHFFRIVHKL